MFDDFTVIHRYTRSQAIADGVLADASTLAKEAGFKFPVALTHAVWTQYVAVPEGVSGQDETGRLWDILSMLRFTIARKPDTGGELFFSVIVRNSENRSSTVKLKCLLGPDDDGGPCLTILLPDED